MKNVILLICLCMVAIAQTRPNAPPAQTQAAQITPSQSVPVQPAQDIMIVVCAGPCTCPTGESCATVHASSDKMTALAKHWHDDHQVIVDTSNNPSIAPKDPSIAFHVAKYVNSSLLGSLLRTYPGPAAIAAQKAVADAQTNLQAVTSEGPGKGTPTVEAIQ